MPVHRKIIWGLVLGASAGLAANALWGGSSELHWVVTNLTYPAGQIFLRLIFMVVVPLIFSALALGVAELGDVRRLGRVGLRTLLFTFVLSSISVLIGVGLVNLVRPGAGLSDTQRAELTQILEANRPQAAAPLPAKSGVQFFLDLIPTNPLEAMVNAFRGEMLAVMFFSLFIGIALALVGTERTRPILDLLRAVYEVVMKVIDLAMRLAPYGVAALLFTLTARFGLEVLRSLSLFALTVLAALALHQFGVYALFVRLVLRYPPRRFFSKIQDIMLTAFSTSSSNATLPTTLRISEENLGVPRTIGGFVLTLGSTANQNGTALYEGVTVLFLAQFFGVELSLGAQLTVVALSILSGVGTAGVPGGSLPMIVVLLEAIGVPGEGIGIILGVDRLLDMCRTVLNVTGDVLTACYVSRAEGHPLRD